MEFFSAVVEEVTKRNAEALRDFRKLFQTAKKEKYYDAEQDESNRKKYYLPFNTNPLNNKEAFLQLSELLQETHTNKLNYNDARHKHLYPRVDLQPDNMLKSIYSGEEFIPEKIMQADLKISRELVKKATEQFSSMKNMNAALFSEHLAVLDAEAMYNAEHSVPQSWFAKKDPMKSDLHHLFTCETTCNSFRGNIPFYDFTDFPDGKSAGCGKREGNKFEPLQGRGAVARATLYFLVRYPGEINNNSKEYTLDSISILLKWHKENDVSQYELHRNAEIFRVQGNRNPMIDHPEWSSKIDFALGLG